MFEQELYNQEVARIQSEPGDLFYNHEIRNWNLSPRIYKILAISAVFNIALLAFIGETNLLTTRGCDSPFIGRVCQVLDTVYVSAMIFGTDREYVDAAYEKTDLGDAEITYIDVSGVGDFQYPPGYFALANPEQAAGYQDPMLNSTSGFPTNIPGMPYNPTLGNDLVNTPQVLPKNNPNPVTNKPDSPYSFEDNPTITKSPRKGRGGRVNGADENSNAVAQNDTNTNSNTNTSDLGAAQPDVAKADQNGVFINKRPLKDYAKAALEKVDSKAVKLENSFKVVISGTLAPAADGRIILKNPKLVRARTDPVNDPAMEKLVQDAIIAVGDAGWFGYLDKLKSKNVTITVEQNDTELIASVRADQPTENDAKHAASGINTLLSFAVPAAKGDDQTFLKQATTTADGKTFVLNFSIPKPLVQEMIMRKLAESKETKTEPSSTAVIKPGNNAASK